VGSGDATRSLPLSGGSTMTADDDPEAGPGGHIGDPHRGDERNRVAVANGAGEWIKGPIGRIGPSSRQAGIGKPKVNHPCHQLIGC
jgi:hypothetical protein